MAKEQKQQQRNDVVPIDISIVYADNGAIFHHLQEDCYEVVERRVPFPDNGDEEQTLAYFLGKKIWGLLRNDQYDRGDPNQIGYNLQITAIPVSKNGQG